MDNLDKILISVMNDNNDFVTITFVFMVFVWKSSIVVSVILRPTLQPLILKQNHENKMLRLTQSLFSS